MHLTVECRLCAARTHQPKQSQYYVCCTSLHYSSITPSFLNSTQIELNQCYFLVCVSVAVGQSSSCDESSIFYIPLLQTFALLCSLYVFPSILVIHFPSISCPMRVFCTIHNKNWLDVGSTQLICCCYVFVLWFFIIAIIVAAVADVVHQCGQEIGCQASERTGFISIKHVYSLKYDICIT